MNAERISGPRGGAAARSIQELILAEDLRPGDPLPTESELCERLGVSRSSVREAVRTLSSLDIVEVRHGHGTFVGRLSLAPLVDGLLFRARLGAADDTRVLREVVQMRIGLDLSVAEELVAAYRGTDNPDLRSLVEDMRTCAARGESFAVADRAFHESLLRPVDNELIRELVSAFWEVHTGALPLLGIAPDADILDTVDAHQAMVDALEAGDVAGYREAVMEHYAPLLRVLARGAAAGADAGAGTGVDADAGAAELRAR
ncbi:FadR/GntR family transcriptional regulator [Brachybacterium nesterenkovii]|nr:FadR/GntR family transcriptional regulator [Brachybacterium nesterenkovii]